MENNKNEYHHRNQGRRRERTRRGERETNALGKADEKHLVQELSIGMVDLVLPRWLNGPKWQRTHIRRTHTAKMINI